MKTLKNSGFRVRAIVLDNHSANVLAYKLLRKEFYHLDDNLLIECDYQKIYLLHDAVHLIKNVRNNLLNYKKLLLKISSFQLPSQFLVNLHQQLLLVIFLRKKMMQNFWNILIHRGLFEILNFSFQTTFWTMLQKRDNEKPGFCRALADWIENWCNEKVPSFEQFPFSLSTVKALIRTLRCQASLIEDSFDDGYDFVLHLWKPSPKICYKYNCFQCVFQ